MNILHLLYESEGDYFGTGGVGARAYEIYRFLKDRHDITLLCRKYPGSSDGKINGLRHFFVGSESDSLTKTLLSYAYHASRYVKSHGNRYDVVIEDFSPAIPTFLHAVTKKPLVLQMQGYTGRLYFRKYNPFYALTLYCLEIFRPRFYKNFIFMNEETLVKVLAPRLAPPLSSPLNLRRDRGGARERKGSYDFGGDKAWLSMNGRRIAIIPNGVSSELLSVSPEDGNYILYLGRIDIYGKGLDLLLGAYEEFHESFPDIRLVIAGDGRERARFEAMLGQLPESVRNNTELLGWVSGENKTEVLRKAMFAVFPSRHEVQPIAVLEAIAGGKPVIVSGIPEFHFVTDAGAGISFETGNAVSLAKSMKDLMTSKERGEMGRRGREWVKDYIWEKIAVRYEKFLNEIVGKSENNSQVK